MGYCKMLCSLIPEFGVVLIDKLGGVKGQCMLFFRKVVTIVYLGIC